LVLIENKRIFQQMNMQTQFQVPEDWHRIKTIDMHTGGEPLRVILSGYPKLQGETILEKRRECFRNLDHLRKKLMWEPRGHSDMYGCLVTRPNDEDADVGVIFMHNEGYSTMCGHATIALGKLAVELGWVRKTEPVTNVTIDAPCGRLQVFVRISGNTVEEVEFHGVPSFIVEKGASIDIPGIGKVSYDLAYGGAFYAFVDSAQLSLDLTPDHYGKIIRMGQLIKQHVISYGIAPKHPFEKDLSFLYGTIFIGDPISEYADSRNVCVFADGEVDRCPTGSGVSARMAIHYQAGDIAIGESMVIESIIGSTFRGCVIREEEYGPYRAVIPSVTGNAFITGQHEFLVDPEDAFREGFFLRG
jgi:trans-L-3-hydroxyproline dehydratase